MTKFEISPYRLIFSDDSVERDYHVHQRPTDAFFIRYLSLVTFIIEVMYCIKDFNWSPHLPEVIVFFRAFYLAPLMLTAYVLTYVDYFKKSSRRLYVLSVFVTLSLIFGQYFMTSMNPDLESSFAKTLPLLLFSTFLFTGLKFKHITILTPIILVTFAYVMIFLRDIDQASKINDSILVVMNVALVIFFKYMLEMSQRKNYIRSVMIKDSEKQLRTSLSAEKNLSSLRKDLIAILAHDIRAPLANVRTVIDLAGEKQLNEEDQDRLLKNLGERIATIDDGVNDLLIWVKSKEEGLELDSSRIRVADVINEILALYKHQAHEKEIEIEVNVQEELGVDTDQGMLKTILRNLVSNAIKYSNVHGKITLAAKETGLGVCFKIQDEGIGMNANDMQRIKKAFYTTPGTHNEYGTGLGLQICHTLLERLGSELHLESEVGRGTLASFQLPAVST